MLDQYPLSHLEHHVDLMDRAIPVDQLAQLVPVTHFRLLEQYDLVHLLDLVVLAYRLDLVSWSREEVVLLFHMPEVVTINLVWQHIH